MKRILLVVCVMWTAVSASGQKAFFDCFDAMYSQRTEFARLAAPIDAHLDSCFAGGYYYLLDFFDPYSDGRATTAVGIAIGDFCKKTTKVIILKMEDGKVTYEPRELPERYASYVKKIFDDLQDSYLSAYPNGTLIYEDESACVSRPNYICIADSGSRTRLYDLHQGNYYNSNSRFSSLYIITTDIRLRLERRDIK